MPSRRVQKAAEAVREVVSWAILTELNDPRVRDVTVTYVEMSGDLRQAKVHVSIMGDEAKQNLGLRGLAARGRLPPVEAGRADRHAVHAADRVRPGPGREEVDRGLADPQGGPAQAGAGARRPETDDRRARRRERRNRRTSTSRTRRTRSTEKRIWPASCPSGQGSRRPEPASWRNRPPATTEPDHPPEEHRLDRRSIPWHLPVAPRSSRNSTRSSRSTTGRWRSTPERPVLEHLLFACCLENARYAAAEEAFAAMVEAFFDWNEIRVSSVRELAEVMARLPDPPAAAGRLKRVLQHVFEDSYSFDLEELRKKNLGPAIDALKKIDGTTPFSVAYVVQAALGGHAIPLDAGTLEVMRILGLATDEDVAGGAIPGLERAIPKSSGVEFASLLQQLGADFAENPFAAELREKLLEIDPEAKSRLPKRGAKKKTAAEEATCRRRTRTAAVEVKAADAEAAEVSGQAQEGKPRRRNPPPTRSRPRRRPRPPRRRAAADDDPHDESGTKKAPSARLSKRKPR